MTLTDLVPTDPTDDAPVRCVRGLGRGRRVRPLSGAGRGGHRAGLRGACRAEHPTGSGKSLVAVAAHFVALARGERSFYTAPIKALVSEKFFALVEIFGADRVGMLTGDASVNPEAPIICCTAEVLANLALRRGTDTGVAVVVMDEFHYYADPGRGWAWQVPLLTLPGSRFLLMSATLGDVSEIAADLTDRTGRPVAVVLGVDRPVPLSFSYVNTPLHETITELLETVRLPSTSCISPRRRPSSRPRH